MKPLLTCATAAAALLLSACGPDPEPVEVAEVDTAVVAPPGTTTGVATAWDTNADGLLQEAEYSAWDQQGISGWDLNNDNRLDQQEFATGWTNAGFSNPDAVFTAWDDDNDTFLSDDEFFDDEEWGEWDTNNSGILEANEFAYY